MCEYISEYRVDQILLNLISIYVYIYLFSDELLCKLPDLLQLRVHALLLHTADVHKVCYHLSRALNQGINRGLNRGLTLGLNRNLNRG